jgi:ABC-type multidrug transport system fused ATPase/permease subunit
MLQLDEAISALNVESVHLVQHSLDKLMDCRRATNATAHVLATERKAADCILVMEVAGSRYLPSQARTKDRI